MTIYFPDVSSFQAGISFAGCVAAIIKATEGTGYVNPDFEAALVRAEKSGTFAVAYHFLHQGNAAAQAAHAHSVAGGVPLMLDVEQESGSNPTVGDVVDFVNAYRALGGTVYLVYLPAWYWSGVLKSPSLAALNSLGLLLVSSNYTSYSNTGPGWKSYGGMAPSVWQYTDKATVNGVRGVDLNAFRGSLADFRSLASTGALSGGNPVLRQGDKGEAVKTLQTRLNVWQAAPQLAVDGSFGPGTYGAVKAFQGSHKLVVDGVAGPATWAALNKAPASSAPAAPKPYPAPANLKLGTIALELEWDAVLIDGKPAASYSVRAYGLNGQLYVSEEAATGSCTLAGLRPGWTYNIYVWANGGPSAPPHASVKVTV